MRLIKKTGTAGRQGPGNPYRAILRRDYPEPFIALLAFILGIWLWDHYFGEVAGYAPGTEQVALVKIDRDLRLADVMADDPRWLKLLAGAGEPEETRRDALEVFGKLAKERALGPRGIEAFAVVKAVQEGLPPRDVLAQVMQGEMISDFAQTSADLVNHRGTWWHAKLIESWEKNTRPVAHWRQVFGEDSMQLKARAVAARSSIWLLGLIGLAFVPGAIRVVAGGSRGQAAGYGGAWPVSLGLVIFMVATLAWIGFSMTLEIGISALPGLHPAVGIFLDSAARLLPALIAMGLLFRRPSHAARVMGLNRAIWWRPIFGIFSLLIVADQALRIATGTADANDPGGSLSASDVGLWGLAFTVVSACLLAPVAEEILYRGVLFRSFRNRLGVVAAAVLSSVVFALLHFYDGYGLASVAIFGISCALLYAGTGSLATVIVLHVIYNASIKIPEWIVYHAPFG